MNMEYTSEYMNTHSIIQRNAQILYVLCALGALSILPAVASATTCTFDRDLEMGSIGEDVRCLQEFLNNEGYIITTTGGGAMGNETTEFKSLTKSALIK